MKLIIATVIFLISSCALAEDKADDKVVLIKSDDKEMLRAINHAQATLDVFLKLYANPPKGSSGFKLKVGFTDPNGGTEHMWVTPFKPVKSGFVGILADDPEYIKDVKYGQKIYFQRKEISDWGYVQDGKQKGSFTVCVMLKHMPPAEAQQFRKDYGFEC